MPEHFRDDRVRGEDRRIDVDGVRRHPQGGKLPRAVLDVAAEHVPVHLLERDAVPHPFLEKAPPRALGRGGVEKELGLRAGEHDGARVAPLGDDAPLLPELPLEGDHRLAHRPVRRDRRRAQADLGRPDRPAHVLPREEEPQLPALPPAFHRQAGAQGPEPRRVGPRHAGPLRRKGHRPVHRPRVEADQAGPLGQQARDGRLAGPRRAVDRDDGPSRHVETSRSRSKKPGNEVPTHAVSATSKGTPEAAESTARDIAIRWSPWLSACPSGSIRAGPFTQRPSGYSPQETPSAASSATIAPIRSDSLTRSSPAPRISVRPSAIAAAAHRTGTSSISAGISSGVTSVAASPRPRTTISATGSPPSLRPASSRMSAPIRRSTPSRPVRNGFTPIPGTRSSDPATLAASAMKKDADEMSPGTAMVMGRSRSAGWTVTSFPSRTIRAPIDRSIRSV